MIYPNPLRQRGIYHNPTRQRGIYENTASNAKAQSLAHAAGWDSYRTCNFITGQWGVYGNTCKTLQLKLKRSRTFRVVFGELTLALVVSSGDPHPQQEAP